MSAIRKSVLLFLFCFCGILNAQVVPSYSMQMAPSATVTDCRSFFYDDGQGTLPGQYASVLPSGSSRTLVINTGNPLITMTFNPTNPIAPQIQIGDFIDFFTGFPPTAGNHIPGGPYTNVPVTGTIPNITSNTGTLVVVWSENGNTSGNGWNGGWFSSAPAPATPATTLVSWPSCSATVIQMTTTAPILCDSLKNNFFNIVGPAGPPPLFPIISTVTPVGCNNGTCTAYNIVIANPGLNQNCDYSINATLFAKDKCDSVYKYPNLISTFSIGTCPITASVLVPLAISNTVCAYSCTSTVRAASPASVCLNLSYAWTPSLSLPPTPGPHAVCPSVTTVYQCTISAGANQTVVTNTIVVIDPQISPSPTAVCTGTNHTFTGSPPGGTWSGPGITAATGFFNSGAAGSGTHTITYSVNGCSTQTQIAVIPINAGSNDAACIGGSTFQVSGGTPGGGVWSGPHISPTGVFTPTQVGVFVVSYSVGPCVRSKSVTVTSALTVPSGTINICKSNWYTYLINLPGLSPVGGRFSKVGPGILNNVVGTFSPALAGPGIHVITYSLASGCFDTFTINVLDIDVSPSTATTCPTKAPFIPTVTTIPASGGTWSCAIAGAIQNPVTGLYNPVAGGVNNHTAYLVYTAPNGCPDTLQMRCIRTSITIDSLFFCTSSPSQQLTGSMATFSYGPVGGVYSGPGVTLAGNYFFNPATAGVGVHTIYYDMNTCRDSIKMIVYPNTITVADRTLCSTHPTVSLITPPLPFGTNWGGAPGVTTPSLGIITPSIPPAGANYPGNLYTYTFTNRASCGTGSANIYVYQFIPASISNLNNVYCYRNQDYIFNVAPPNGTLTAPASAMSYSFNPSAVGAGTHTVFYEFGEGACYTSDTQTLTVYPQLTTTATVSNPTICIGESSLLNVKGEGGQPSVTQYTYTWSHSLTPQSFQNVVPYSTTVYTCVTSDGCSDPAVNEFTVLVHPNYYPAFVTPSIQCYGTAAQVTTNITPSNGPYTYTWSTTPVQSGPILSGIAGKNYFLKIQNTLTGCEKDTSIVVPGWPVIEALFSPDPNLSCVPFEESNITFLDLSNGATAGTWSFNGTAVTYTPGQSVQHEFTNPGSYNVTLDVVNQGNCPSSYAWSICILESTDIFLPDIFSPNKDGANDVLYLRGNGVKEMLFQIYDRWGNKVFESKDVKSGWDGTYKGKDAEPGVYAYYLDVTLYTDKKITQKGDITLVR